MSEEKRKRGRPKTEESQQKQAEILAYIVKCIEETGQSPTHREIEEAVKISHAEHCISALVRKGLITRESRGTVRNIRVVGMPMIKDYKEYLEHVKHDKKFLKWMEETRHQPDDRS